MNFIKQNLFWVFTAFTFILVGGGWKLTDYLSEKGVINPRTDTIISVACWIIPLLIFLSYYFYQEYKDKK